MHQRATCNFLHEHAVKVSQLLMIHLSHKILLLYHFVDCVAPLSWPLLQVLFKRDGGTDVLSTAAELLGHAAGSHVRCFHLPMFEKALGWSVHLYINLQVLHTCAGSVFSSQT